VQDVTLRRTQGDSQILFCFILSVLHRRKCAALWRCNEAIPDTYLYPFRDRQVVFLRALVSLLANVHVMHSPLILNRIVKVLLSTLSILLPAQSDIKTGPVSIVSKKGRKGRKRAHDYEGDEIFNITTNVICPTSTHNMVISTTLDGMSLTALVSVNTR
jgi:hypothetical protein